MAITTIAGAISKLQYPQYFSKTNSNTGSTGVTYSIWADGGSIGVGLYDTTLNGLTLSSTSAQVTGQVPFSNPASGNTYLSTFRACSSIFGGSLMLCDRLWHNGGLSATSTSAQTITSPTWPARDVSGSTNGDGVLLALEVSNVTGSGTPTITVSYTNQAGTSGQTATNIKTTLSSSPTGSVYFLSLAPGDTGVRSVQSLTLSATWTSGTINLVAYRPIAMLDVILGKQSKIDALTGAFQRLFDGTVPFFYAVVNNTVARRLTGFIQYSQG